jgi:hypothetical protein
MDMLNGLFHKADEQSLFQKLGVKEFPFVHPFMRLIWPLRLSLLAGSQAHKGNPQTFSRQPQALRATSTRVNWSNSMHQ